MRMLWVAGLASGLACSGTGTKPPEPQPPPPTSTATTDLQGSVASASPSLAHVPDPPPMPSTQQASPRAPRPAVTDPNVAATEAILRDVCRVEYLESEDGSVDVGCGDCNLFEGATEAFDVRLPGELASARASAPPMSADFLGVASKQAVLSFGGSCGRRSTTKLFVHDGKRWTPHAAEIVDVAGACAPLPRADGRHVLACVRSASFMTTWVEQVVVVDFTSDDPMRVLHTFWDWDSVNDAVIPNNSVVEVSLGKLTVRDLNGDGAVDVVVAASGQRKNGSKIRQEEGDASNVGKPQPFELHYLNNGKTIIPAPRTVHWLKAIDKKLPPRTWE